MSERKRNNVELDNESQFIIDYDYNWQHNLIKNNHTDFEIPHQLQGDEFGCSLMFECVSNSFPCFH